MPIWLSKRFRGIRHAAGWDASEAVRNSHTNSGKQLARDRVFRRGLSELQKRGLSFDAWLYHPQMPELIELAQHFPKLVNIADNFCWPLGIGLDAGQQEFIYSQWQQDFEALARFPNVHAKLGGIAMPINSFGWHRRGTPASSDELVAQTGS